MNVQCLQVVEKDCNTLGALLQRILGLLSKQKEAADLFARECLASGMAAGPSDPGTEAMLAVPVATGESLIGYSYHPSFQSACKVRA